MMNGKVRAFNGDMGMAMSVFKDMVGKVRFVFADPPYKITQARYDEFYKQKIMNFVKWI